MRFKTCGLVMIESETLSFSNNPEIEFHKSVGTTTILELLESSQIANVPKFLGTTVFD
ncbi:hypothetical protein LIH_02320 [Leptospira interrogans serovar Hardjo-prajitno]|uniref:Uncharacterized protein n=4 Tax=Leptospira interrogans TaxID=173 RepID=A0AAQ1NXC5_LEPIR|nr:hypothetical protein LIH_02320 [Leptospira interrogans serovar Hardjo-prajitno]SOR61535.1 conserved hypothetical protein [Leptospira interrogans serovar Manilae]